MEFNPSSRIPSLIRSTATFLATQIRLAREQLANADLNPHEGQLRASAYMTQENIPNLVPDYPPMDSDGRAI